LICAVEAKRAEKTEPASWQLPSEMGRQFTGKWFLAQLEVCLNTPNSKQILKMSTVHGNKS
jgi:hypothetical protein